MVYLKKYAALFCLAGIGLFGLAVLLFFFLHFGLNDSRTIKNFTTAYNKYDRAVTEYSDSVFAAKPQSAPDDLERNADEALADLTATASARISSLTKHDGEAMQIMAKIAVLSGNEIATLKAYQRESAGDPAELDRLAKELGDLREEIKMDYARFQAFARD